MCQAVREATPIEVLEKDLISVLTRPLNEESRLDLVKKVIEKAKGYENDYYNRQWEVKRAQLKDEERKNRILETQNRVLTEYILFNEGEFKGRA